MPIGRRAMFVFDKLQGAALLLVVAALLIARGHLAQASPQPGEDCSFYYIVHPPPELPCNPYGRDYMRLECSVAGPNPDGNSIVINWYVRPNGTAEAKPIDDKRISPFGTNNGNRSRLRFPVEPWLAGDYWCQIAVTSVEVDLIPSMVTSVKPLEYYNGFPDCAVNPYLHYPQLMCAEKTLEPSPSSPSTSSPPDVDPTKSLATAHGGCSVTVTVARNLGSNDTTNDEGIGVPLAGVMLIAVGAPVLVAIVILILVVVMTVRRNRDSGKTGSDEGTKLVPMVTNPDRPSEEGDTSNGQRSQSLPPRLHLEVGRRVSTESAYEDMLPSRDGSLRSVIRRLQVACGRAPRPLLPPPANKQTTVGVLAPPQLSHPPRPIPPLPTNGLTGIEEDDNGGMESWAVASANVNEDGPSLEYAEPETRLSGHDKRNVRKESGGSYVNGDDDRPRPQYQGLDHGPQYQGLDHGSLEYMALYDTPDTQADSHQYQLPISSSMEPISLYTVPATDGENY